MTAQQPARRRPTLRQRIYNLGPNVKRRNAGLIPVSGASSVTGGAASPGGAPMVMPLSLVSVYPQPGGEYSTLTYQGLQPMFTADGAVIPATAPGRWGQVIAAGNPNPQSQRGVRAPIAGAGMPPGRPQTGAGRTAW